MSILKVKISFIAFPNLIAAFFFEVLLNYVLQSKSKNFLSEILEHSLLPSFCHLNISIHL